MSDNFAKDILERLDRIEHHLKAQTIQEKEILTFKECCAFLDLSESFMYKLTSDKMIPFFKPNNKKLYFRKEDLLRWMQTNRSTE